MPIELLLILLPLAAFSGWWLARRRTSHSPSGTRIAVDLASDYFKGINYFLNDQPDKAINVFIHALEIDSSVVEPHMALGSLFRRRGEVDRAIHIHQNLIARPTLSREQRNQALFELAQDYMQAGLLDRAENLYRELLERDKRNVAALHFLKDVYEQEKEWQQAIEAAKKIESLGDDHYETVIAHYFCELAEQALSMGDAALARKNIKRALSKDKSCIRASLLLARVAEQAGNDKAAVKLYQRAAEQNPNYLSEVVKPWLACLQRLKRSAASDGLVVKALFEQDAIYPVLDYVDYLEAEQGVSVATAWLGDYLEAHPSMRGYLRLIHLVDDKPGQKLARVREKIMDLLKESSLYNCFKCGFSPATMVWQCPSCRGWETIKPNSDMKK